VLCQSFCIVKQSQSTKKAWKKSIRGQKWGNIDLIILVVA
jgi:hypothetical protein